MYYLAKNRISNKENLHVMYKLNVSVYCDIYKIIALGLFANPISVDELKAINNPLLSEDLLLDYLSDDLIKQKDTDEYILTNMGMEVYDSAFNVSRARYQYDVIKVLITELLDTDGISTISLSDYKSLTGMSIVKQLPKSSARTLVNSTALYDTYKLDYGYRNKLSKLGNRVWYTCNELCKDFKFNVH